MEFDDVTPKRMKMEPYNFHYDHQKREPPTWKELKEQNKIEKIDPGWCFNTNLDQEYVEFEDGKPKKMKMEPCNIHYDN